MPLKDPDTGYTLFQNLGFVLMSLWGGLTTYIVDIRKQGRKFRFVEVLLQLSVSGFAGALSGFLAWYYELPFPLAGFVCGVAGFMGSRAIDIFTSKFRQEIA